MKLRTKFLSAFALLGGIMMAGQFLAGLMHNRLLDAGYSLRDVFVYSPAVAAVGATVLFIYSFTPHGRYSPGARPLG